MSNEAINWALALPIKHSTAKFVLVVMANCADTESWQAWPSVAHLSEATGQDRKTVIENIKRLIAMGHIHDTGSRKGATGQVPIYQLNSSKIGTVEDSQNRNSSENGTVPEFPINSTEIPYKESRFSLVTVPKTGHGTQKNHKEKIDTSKPKGQLNVTLPDWLPADTWQNWVEYRKGIKAALSPHSAKLCIAKLGLLREQGSDPCEVINNSIMSGKWTGLFAVKDGFKNPAPAAPARKDYI